MKNLFMCCLLTLICGLSTLNAQEAIAVNAKIESPVKAEMIKWDHMTFNFGEIAQNIPAEAKFTLTNTSDQPLLLKEVKPTCGCTIAAYDQEPILPGESTEITTTYNAKKGGSFQKTIKVLTNLSDTPIALKLKGKVVSESE